MDLMIQAASVSKPPLVNPSQQPPGGVTVAVGVGVAVGVAVAVTEGLIVTVVRDVDQMSIAGLNRARGAAKTNHAASSAKRHRIEPSWRQSEMLGEPDRGIGTDGEARDR